MNAYELAEALEKGELIEFFEKHTQFWKVAVVKDSATILRQQADRIAELEKGLELVKDAYCVRDSECKELKSRIAELEKDGKVCATCGGMERSI